MAIIVDQDEDTVALSKDVMPRSDYAAGYISPLALERDTKHYHCACFLKIISI